MIGVATAELRNKADQYEHNDSMCIDYFHRLYSDGRQRERNFRLKEGDRVTVHRT